MAQRAKSSGRGREPSLRDQIAESGETPIDGLRQALQTDQTDRRYLGREFLTWLLYYADEQNGDGHFEDEEGNPFQVKPGGRVSLKALGDGASEIMAKGAAPAQMADVRYAIAGGLTVREAEILVTVGDRVWQASLTAETFDLKRVKLPELLGETDVECAMERLELVDQLDALLLHAYDAFLRRRLQRDWEPVEMARVRAWLARSILEPETTLEGILEEIGPIAEGGAAVHAPARVAPRRRRRESSDLQDPPREKPGKLPN